MHFPARASNSVVAFFVFAGVGLALPVACPTAPPGFPMASAPPSFGCAEIDKSFSSFVDTAIVGTLAQGPQFAFSTTGAPPSGDTMFPVTAILTATGSQQLSPSYEELVAFTAISNTGGSFPSPATPGATWAIDGIIFNPNINVNGNAQAADAILDICLNAPTVSGCPALQSGTITVSYIGSNPPAYNCSPLSIGCVATNSNQIVLSSPVTEIGIRQTVLVNPTNTLGVTVQNFDVIFDGTAVLPAGPGSAPEPSTFLLVGVGLAWG